MNRTNRNAVLLKNVGQLVTYDPAAHNMQIISQTEIAIQDTKIAAIGRDLYSPEQEVVDLGGRLVTPSFIDAHTHPIFIGHRADEFEQRLLGKSYQEIAAMGGGILKSVLQLRLADDRQLAAAIEGNLKRFLQFGTTTIEAKSGYGLSTVDELRSLRLLKAVSASLPLTVLPTFLGAHAYPPEYRSDHQAYIDLIVNQMLPAVVQEDLACFCDVFCDEGAFDVQETRQIVQAAQSLGLGIRLHADEFKAIGALTIAREFGALSVDHLTAITPEGLDSLIGSGIVPVLLPGTSFFLGNKPCAPARAMLERGLPVALATDFNPGSCMIQSLPLIMSLACLIMRLTPLEALQATTYNAALALNLQKVAGALQPGYDADLVVWEFDDYRAIPYYVGIPTIKEVWKKGRVVWQAGKY